MPGQFPRSGQFAGKQPGNSCSVSYVWTLRTAPGIESSDGRSFLSIKKGRNVTQAAGANGPLAESWFRRILEAAPNAMIVVDQGRKIALVTQGAEQLFGYRRDELIGQELDVLVPERLRPQHPSDLPKLLQDTRAMGEGGELFGRRKDGSEVAIEVGLSRVEAPQGPLTLASIVDITARRHSEAELRRSNEELAQFAYITSHDLQEPLRMVASYTELLAQRYQGKLDERADKYIYYAVDGAMRMQRLLADLLAYSRVGSQGKPLVAVSSEAVVKSVIDGLSGPILQANARVEVGPLPSVRADEPQLAQLFQNLIGNALKFRGEAPPLVEISATPLDDRWQFSVKDNGIGIANQHMERIFQMFQRLHERGKYEGSGAGLAVAKRIAERHGGRIWLESEPLLGSTFFFTLEAATLPGST
jgi:PAS domain S-box-containing protein